MYVFRKIVDNVLTEKRVSTGKTVPVEWEDAALFELETEDRPPQVGWSKATGVWTPPPSITSSVDPREVRRDEIRSLPDTADMLDKLRNASPQQIDDWVNSNVTTLAQVRVVFRAILKVLAASL